MNTELNLKLTVYEQFLCSVLTHRDYLNCELIGEIYNSNNDSELFSLCENNKITSIAADALRKCHVDIPEHWLDKYKVTQDRITMYMSELDKVSALFAKNEIPLVALKNSGITRAIYPHYAACPMGDIDVLVRKADFQKAHLLLVKSGYELKFRSPLEEEDIDEAERGGGSEYAVNLPNGEKLWFELQWRPVAGRWIRPDQEPSSEDLVRNAINIDGSGALLLSPVDNLLQVSLHTAKHTYVRAPGFRLHTDVDRIVRDSLAENKIEWDLFVANVKKLQVKTAVYFSLALAKDLLKTPVPGHVLIELKPNKWKINIISKWLQRVGLFDPDGKKWGRIGYVFFVILLYDDLFGFVRSVVPEKAWIQERYGISNPFVLPFLYLHRLLDVLVKRTLSK